MWLRNLAGWAFRLWPRRDYIIYGEQRLTRGQVWAQINALAAGLQQLGVQPGDRIAVLLPARPEAFYPIFLPGRIGAVIVPLNPLWHRAEIGHALRDAGVRVVITQPTWLGQNYPALLAELAPTLPDLQYVLVCDAEQGDGDRFLPYSAVVQPDRRPHSVQLDDAGLNFILYTSGSTGAPKGIAHTFRSIGRLPMRAGLRHLRRSPLRALFLPLPPFQFAGIFGAVAALLAGGRLVLPERFTPTRALELIARERVTQIGASPTILRLLLRALDTGKYDLSALQRITLSTEPCPQALAEAAHTRFGCHLQNIYGMTETLVIAWTSPDDPWERAATTVGKPIPGVQVRIVDDERRDLPPGKTGEIAVKTDQIMCGYYNDPALTAQVMDGDGWFYTGDLGYLGADGYLRLVDRKKDLIIRGGQNIFPAEIEAHLHTHPAIRRAAVVGIPDALSGEAVWAYIERYPGAVLSAGAVLDFCRQSLAAYKVPAQVRFIDHAPVNGANKVEKYKLRELASKELNHDAA